MRTFWPTASKLGGVIALGALFTVKDKHNQAPSDYLDRKVADTIRTPGETRADAPSFCSGLTVSW